MHARMDLGIKPNALSAHNVVSPSRSLLQPSPLDRIGSSHKHIQISTQTHTHTHTHPCSCTYTYARTPVQHINPYMHLQYFTRADTHKHTHTNTHTQTHTQTPTHKHTHKHTQLCECVCVYIIYMHNSTMYTLQN